MTKTSTSTQMFLFVAVAALMLIGFALPAKTHAASPTSLQEMKQALENMQSTMMQLRRGSSTVPRGTGAMFGGASSTRATSTRAINFTCMQTAVTARENAIMTAGTKYVMSMKAAMEARKTGLIAAWTGTDITATRTQYMDVWNQWKKDRLAAQETLRKDRQAAWNTFKTTAVKTCKAKLPKEEAAGQDTGSNVGL